MMWNETCIINQFLWNSLILYQVLNEQNINLPSDVKLFYVIEDILCELDVFGGWTTSLVDVSWDIPAYSLDGAEAVTGDDFFCSFALDYLDALVIGIWTCVRPIPPPIEDGTAPRVSANTFVAPQTKIGLALTYRTQPKQLNVCLSGKNVKTY